MATKTGKSAQRRGLDGKDERWLNKYRTRFDKGCAITRLVSTSSWFSLSVTVLVTACDTGQLPHDAVISVAPTERQFQITALADSTGRCIFDKTNHQDVPVVVSLRDAHGSPMTHAELIVYADYAGNSYPGLEVLGLYDDQNGNGVLDADSELVSGADDGVFTTRTDRYSGDRHLWLRINLSCPFAGEVRAFAGDLTDRVRIEVIAGATVVTPAIGQARESE